MKFEPGDSYFVDDNTEITDLLDAPEDANFDAVLTDLDGYHPEGEEGKRIVNDKSQKAYYILEGTGIIFAGDKEHEVSEGEMVHISEGTSHALQGDFKAIIITSPPFNPEDEELIEK